MKNVPSSVAKITAIALAVTLAGCSSTATDATGDTTLVQTKKPVLLSAAPVMPNTTWKLIWSDEFDGDSIDKRKWGFEENCWGGGNNEQQCYTKRKSNAFVADGKLNIVAKKGSFQTRLKSLENGDYELTLWITASLQELLEKMKPYFDLGDKKSKSMHVMKRLKNL